MADDCDVACWKLRLQNDSFSSGCGHLLVHVCPRGSQHWQIRCNYASNEFLRKLWVQFVTLQCSPLGFLFLSHDPFDSSLYSVSTLFSSSRCLSLSISSTEIKISIDPFDRNFPSTQWNRIIRDKKHILSFIIFPLVLSFIHWPYSSVT